MGLTTVRGIGEELAKAIVEERAAHGRYRSLADLLRRTGLPRPAAEHLIAVGALSEFGLSRRELLWQLGLLLPGSRSPKSRVASPKSKVKKSDSGSRSGDAGLVRGPRQSALPLPIEQDMVRLKDLTDWERMVADYGLLGLSPSYHPLALLRKRLPNDLVTAARLRTMRDGARVRTVGLVVCRQ